MIRGRVSANRASDGTTALEALIEIGVAGRSRIFQTMEVVVDTGFTGWLTLPGDAIGQIGLVSRGQRPAILASGEEMLFDIYAALVEWRGQVRPVIVHEAGGKPLVGMSPLAGSRLLVDAREGGDVTIEEIQDG